MRRAWLRLTSIGRRPGGRCSVGPSDARWEQVLLSSSAESLYCNGSINHYGKRLMRKLASELPARLTTLTTAAVLGLLPVCVSAPLSTNEILAAYQEPGHYAALTILYSGNETVFPPEIVPCTFSWREGAGKADAWLILLEFPDGRGRLSFLS